MKEMIEKFGNVFAKWGCENVTTDEYLGHVGTSLIAVMERLDAMEQPPKVARMEHVNDAEKYAVPEYMRAHDRAVMIKALRWAILDGASLNGMNKAIARLENGGEL